MVPCLGGWEESASGLEKIYIYFVFLLLINASVNISAFCFTIRFC